MVELELGEKWVVWSILWGHDNRNITIELEEICFVLYVYDFNFEDLIHS